MNRLFIILRQFDWLLFLTLLILVGMGMVAIYSSISSQSSGLTFLNKQMIAFGFGIIVFFFLSFMDYRLLKNFSYFIYILSVLLLIAVLFFGKSIRGTQGWFDFGFFQFQPSEFAKIGLLIILAKYFASITGKSSRFQFILISGILTLIPVTLIMLQPDLGSALALICLWFFLLLFCGIKRIYLLLVSLVGLGSIWLSWFFLLADYQKERILSFLNPYRDPLGSGYALIQSKIAVGSGGILGKGLGFGPQSQLQFLPEHRTDFIFAGISEELGFLGAFLLLSLFCFLILRILRVAALARDEFGSFLALGTVFIFMSQIFINIGMNLGLVPVTGVPLPLISYGGSSLLASLITLGIVQSVFTRHRGLIL